MKRSSGILLPIFALPSPYGIGTLGGAAFEFVDFLAAAGQSWWQVLPVGPTSYGDSPYQSLSTFAGNPYFIDLDALVEDGLLRAGEVRAVDWGADETRVDYGRLYERRFALLAKAAETGLKRDAEAVAAFASEKRGWLEDYALFMALKRHFAMKPWMEWPEEVRMRKAEALDRYRTALSDDVALFTYIQYLFYRQWAALRAYARERGVGIIGDLPIYVAMDSADVWASPESFQLDEKNVPIAVAGVPPDYFSADGQLWGNPLYRWEDMKKDGFGWWIRRVEGAAELFDVLRIDHFRGFESYWAVPYGATTARHDFSLQPPRDTVVDKLLQAGLDTIGVGKIYDIFAGRGISRTSRTVNNDDGMDQTIAHARSDFHGLCFVNLVDFDMVYGHRNDIPGYTAALNRFDERLGELMPLLGPDDVLMITADHGCDPGTASTDHSREYVPLLIYGASIRAGVDLGTRPTFADTGETAAALLGVKAGCDGVSLCGQILR